MTAQFEPSGDSGLRERDRVRRLLLFMAILLAVRVRHRAREMLCERPTIPRPGILGRFTIPPHQGLGRLGRRCAYRYLAMDAHGT